MTANFNLCIFKGKLTIMSLCQMVNNKEISNKGIYFP